MIAASVSLAETRTVTNCATEGAGSLKEALTSLPNEPSIIEFNIPTEEAGYTTEAGVSFWRMTPAGRYVLNRDGLQVRGSTQTTNQGDKNPFGPEIEINGVNLPTNTPIFEIIGNNKCTIEGLILNRSKSHAISISTGNDHDIYGCYIGTDVSGETFSSNEASGIYFYLSGDNKVGGAYPAFRNIISGNKGNGIYLQNSTYTYIIGNYIGTNRSGSSNLGNQGSGILMDIGSNHQYVASGNIIAFNGQDGIQIDGSATNFNALAQNSYFSNVGQGIKLLNSANQGIIYPNIATAEYYAAVGLLYLQGTGPVSSTIELLKVETPEVEPRGEGKTSLGFAQSDSSGAWFVYLPTDEAQGGDKVTALATDQNGNSSEFSINVPVIGGTSLYRPDAMIGLLSDSSDYIGEDIFNSNGFGQTKEKIMYVGETAIYYIKVKNSSNIDTDRMVVTGTSNSSGWEISYYDSKAGGNDITSQVVGSGWVTPSLATSEALEMKMVVKSISATPSTKEAYISAVSYTKPTRKDVVLAKTIANASTAQDRYSFSISLPSSAEANKPFLMTITAKNISGSVTTEIAGNTHLSADSGTISVTSIESAQFADDGIWQGNVQLSHVGARTISVSNDFISAVAAAQIEILIPAEVTTGGLYRFGPNPYNPLSGQTAAIWYWLNDDKTTSVNIFDLQGNLLSKKIYQAGINGGRNGINSVSWDGKNNFGEILENGIYFVKVAQDSKVIYSGKIIILK